jgi:chlorobactene glucosyltransferase
VTALLPALPWFVPYLFLFWLARRKPDLRQHAARTGRSLSVVIPARNEARTIGTVLESILRSSYAPLEVIVVDDRSTDETAALVERFARLDARVRLVRGQELPAGWYGKPWACLQGFRAAAGELIVFTDADTRHEPILLAHAVGALAETGASLVTVAPRQECVTFWERLVMPQIWLLLGLRYHPRRVNRARRTRDVIANGQFVMVTRESYERVGTHEVVHDEVAEDLALALRFHQAGQRIYFAFAEALMETRMYHDLQHLIEGWSKNIYLGGRRSFPEEPLLRALAPWGLALVMIFWLVPPVWLGLALATGGGRLTPALATASCVLFWTGVSIRRQIPYWYGLLYPLGAAMSLYIVLRSTWRGARKVEWKGRTYGRTAPSAEAGR